MDLAYELHDLVRTLDREAERMLRPLNLTYNRYLALEIVGEHPGVSGAQLARALGITEASCSALVRRLIADGLAADLAQKGGGNVRRLHLTENGELLRGKASHALGGPFDDVVRRLGFDPLRLAQNIRSIHDDLKNG